MLFIERDAVFTKIQRCRFKLFDKKDTKTFYDIVSYLKNTIVLPKQDSSVQRCFIISMYDLIKKNAKYQKQDSSATY